MTESNNNFMEKSGGKNATYGSTIKDAQLCMIT